MAKTSLYAQLMSEVLEDLKAEIRRDIMGDREPETRASVNTAARVEPDEDAPAAPRKRRRMRRVAPLTRYVVQHRDAPEDVMTAGQWETYRAMLKADKRGAGLTESEVIAAWGRTDSSAKKAAQSNIWFLRNHNRKGERVEPGSRGAIVVNMEDDGE